MIINWNENRQSVELKQADCFQLEDILTCGQCFRWLHNENGSWDIAASSHLIRAEQTERAVRFQGCTMQEFRDFWAVYFDLDRDYRALQKRLTRNDPVMKKAVSFGGGIRILQQDLWESMVEFILSQNNNIPRIQGCIERLCQLCGKPLARNFLSGGGLKNQIPGPETLAEMTVDDLAPVRLGYRAKYLIQSAARAVEYGLPESYDELLKFSGIGPKVASCIQLFGLHDFSAFPIDVWVMRLMHELYGLDPEDKKEMARYADGHFHDLAGLAQQYLFYYMRSGLGR
ncbi:MAG: DNA-3-methyladenine glycosylase 2 family protein [Eubacterium sp.]|jgi:N-glycosylase/DNA lyase|nr:DNA-3-methyladenine glycosylase 2 family protein [Eubacterium sp.]MCH4047162.1 DNA-3-methyladenine glycosylase 2 family protein [Eubacterium sp.]MCH4080260.1 DNA-3-methyladenine glycosylase 2 family protein [Eubacterium sp.]MCH4110821.1 DNA-3-methyladenine glycosylase 2 family protein [Eubacterium sp.]MCI1307772.1 DNA-3-methyladenine glycosylase 2 family protein [Eubacterium sp.]